MSSACTHPTLVAPGLAAPTLRASTTSLLARARARVAALATALTLDDVPADRAYARLLAGSGGKFTDALEREADRRLRGSWDSFSDI
jgi:hypothetical protein